MTWLDTLSPRRIALGIFLITLAVFLGSPVRQVADSNYSMLVSEALLTHGTVRLDDYSIPGFDSSLPTAPIANYQPYQLQRKANHVYYLYPPGSSVLSLPYVLAIKLIGVAPVDANGVFNFWGEAIIECSLAALLMASLAVVFFFTSRILLPVSWSALIAFGAAFGTQIWSTASRGLWSDTWGISLLGLAMFLLLDQAGGRRKARPFWLASLLAWSYFVRPTYCVPIITISIYVLITDPRNFLRYAATGAAWLCGFVAYSWYQFGQILPDYFRTPLTFASFWGALAGGLVSPSRGLLVFVPITLFIVYLLLRYRRELPYRALLVLGVCTILAHIFVIAGFPTWWAGHSYGPRYSTGLVPWFVLLAILGTRAALDWHRQHPGAHARLESAAAAVLLILSIAMNGNGALNYRTAEWNRRPANIDERPERAWDWRDPQFLAFGPR